MRKLLFVPPLGTFSASHYIIYIFLIPYNPETIQDIKIKFSAFLSFVEVTNCVKFQSPRCTGFKVGFFRISRFIIKYPNICSTDVYTKTCHGEKQCVGFNSVCLGCNSGTDKEGN